MLKRSSIVSVIAVFVCLIMFGCSSPTKAPVPLTVPTLRTPKDTSSFQPDTLTLIWNPSDSATSYAVQVSTNSGFSSFTVNSTATAPSFAITSPLANNTTYYWRVSASAGDKRTSAWSTTFSFTTGVAPPMMKTTFPQNNGILVPDTLTLTWEASPGDSIYYVQLSTDITFSTTFIINDSSTLPSFVITSPLTDAVIYYWRVKTSKPQGVSLWSVTDSFTTWDPVPPPTLLTPANGGSGVSLTDSLLSWSYSTPWPATYHVQVSTTTDFSSPVLDVPSVSTLSEAISSLSSGTLYYWRVSVTEYFYYYIYRTSDWSATWSFTTQ